MGPNSRNLSIKYEEAQRPFFPFASKEKLPLFAILEKIQEADSYSNSYSSSSITSMISSSNPLDLNAQSAITSSCSCLTTYSYSTTDSDNKVSENRWNDRENVQRRDLDFDKSFMLPVADLPNLMKNHEHFLQQNAQIFGYHQWFQASEQQQNINGMLLDSNLDNLTSELMDIGRNLTGSSVDSLVQIDQIGELPQEAIVNKNYERKQKRMLKNRESAARSRAKRQAHINSLEDACQRLKKMIYRLKSEKVFDQPIQSTKYQLRRANSV